MDQPNRKRRRNRPSRGRTSATQSTLRLNTSDVATPVLTEVPSLDSPRFADLNTPRAVVDQLLIDTITKDLGFEYMMPVQAATIHDLLPPKRRDCLVQAKTGTGKTLAFLLPAIQTLLNKKETAKSQNSRHRCISLLVLAPTRELAMQIAKEATNLLQRIPEHRVCISIGGSNKDREEKQILGGCDILIATPGRLLDHLSSSPAIKQSLGQLDTLVLDEADRLLDMGFLPALQKIMSYLSEKVETRRQGMLFSATVPSHVADVADLILSTGYATITTIPPGEVPTHTRVPQILVQVPNFSDLVPALIGTIRQELSRSANDPSFHFKAIIFAQTAALADFYGFLISRLPDMPSSWTLHARHAQSKRTNVTNAFRNAEIGILVATDVVARGMDFPSVTTVIQVGIPMDKESYIHRLGRTARGAAASGESSIQGRGVFLVADEESFFPTRILQAIHFNVENADLSSAQHLAPLIDSMDETQVAKIYQAWLGYYKGHMKPLRWNNAELVARANMFARTGLHADGIPALQKSTVGKMGLRGTPGLNIVPDVRRFTKKTEDKKR